MVVLTQVRAVEVLEFASLSDEAVRAAVTWERKKKICSRSVWELRNQWFPDLGEIFSSSGYCSARVAAMGPGISRGRWRWRQLELQQRRQQAERALTSGAPTKPAWEITAVLSYRCFFLSLSLFLLFCFVSLSRPFFFLFFLMANLAVVPGAPLRNREGELIDGWAFRGNSPEGSSNAGCFFFFIRGWGCADPGSGYWIVTVLLSAFF